MAEKLISTEQFEEAVKKIMDDTDRGVHEMQYASFVILLRLRELSMFKQLELELFGDEEN
jgi:hypothetical protein